MKFENIRVYNFEHALRGMRNPKNSWHLSDSSFGLIDAIWGADLDNLIDKAAIIWENEAFTTSEELKEARRKWVYKNGIQFPDKSKSIAEYAFIGPKDMKLAQTLIRGGSEHRKFLRQIFVTVDITAPLYW